MNMRVIFALGFTGLALMGCDGGESASANEDAEQQERLERIEEKLAQMQATAEVMAERSDAFYRVVGIDLEEDTVRESSPSQAAIASSLISTLQTLRSQITLYANQHNDAVPDLLSGWGQLLHRTSNAGKIGTGDEFVYGPYMRSAPRNTFTESTKVCLLDEFDPRAGWVWDAESKIIFAVVSDEFAKTNSLDEGDVVAYSHAVLQQASELRGDLAVLRNAIDLYATEHAGNYPLLENIDAMLTQYTDYRGNTSEKKGGDEIYGPYLRRLPTNPFTDSSRVGPMSPPSPKAGWAYDERTGEVLAVINDPGDYQSLRASFRGDLAPTPHATGQAPETSAQ